MINLLPEEIRGEIELSKKNVKLRHFAYYSIAIFVFTLSLIAVLIFYLFTLKSEAEKQKKLAIQQIEKQDVAFGKASDLQDRINLIKKLKRSSVDWNKVLQEIGNKTPANVQIDNFNGTLDKNNRTKITGSAANEKDVVAFKENLSSSEIFSYVDVESIVKGVDSGSREVKSFVISLVINQDKAK